MMGRGEESAHMGMAPAPAWAGLGWVTAATSDLEGIAGCRVGEPEDCGGGVGGHAC